MKILLVPIGEIDQEILELLASKLREIFGCQAERKKPLCEKLDYAYAPKRRQYHSTTILEKIASSIPIQGSDKLLGIVDQDIFVENLNFVFGEARPAMGVAIISLCRLRQAFYGLPEDNDLFLQRTIKEAVHELGHTFGLSHCRNRRCVMFFSNSLHDTDIKGSAFCSICQRSLGHLSLSL